MDGTATVIGTSCVSKLATAGADEQHGELKSSGFVMPTTHFVFHDVDEFTEALLDWNIELTQLHPGVFRGSATILPLGPLLITAGSYNQALLQRVSPPERCLTINRPGHGSDPLAVQGHDVKSGEVFVSGSEAEREGMNRGVLFFRAASLRLDFLQAQMHWLDESLVAPKGSLELHSPGDQWTANFLAAIEWITDAALRYPQFATREDVRGSLVDTFLDRVNTLGAAHSPLSDDRETRAARRLAVERAREYIRVNLTEPIRLSDLCKYARSQARSLEYGFREVLGVSPIAYVRAIRLQRVRRLLRSTAVRTRTISEIALDCGFWHLSQFAVDYKHLFTESPSTTYRRTQAQLPRSERRRTAPAVPLPHSRAANTRSCTIRAAVSAPSCLVAQQPI